MTDLEFEIIDELYFVQSFEKLVDELDIGPKGMVKALDGLIAKGWVRCFYKGTDEPVLDNIDLQNNYNNYLYLATKEGLLKHNS